MYLRSGNNGTFSFNLSRNIVAMQVETHWRTYYRVRDHLLSQQNAVLQIGNVLRKLDSSTTY